MAMSSGATSGLARTTGQVYLSHAVAFAYISHLASAIEGDPARVEEWYRCACIRELGGQTAQELVMQGEADRVVDFLYAIRCGERD
ncbi:antitoxin Xre/MbcA/ParS toxin-binding domain-containing protein [Dyella choica]|uniref:DUF2384 domain-containing protein n=1 Tax=Dyella choica TaxID=1927959 RepID=A0A3S0S888_9GAMM|nr:antitoxin Xre/MbcA/ParS toxin-binding domain-containing protein [Dyella choica]RUL72481.1 DUF2384 domain-containing protein [Dyella choica]